MSLLDEYKKRQKENKQVTNNNLFYELKQRKAFETQKDIISRMNSWNNNSSAFMNEFKNRFYDKDGNYIDGFRSDTNDALIKAKVQKKHLDTERESLSKILKEYESFYDENWVKNIRLQLANGHFGQDKIIESYVSNNNLFSQFENADEFDKWSEQQKKDEELRKTDLNYTKNQITVLELDFEKMQNLRKKESELFSELSTKEYALKEQNRRADLTVDPKLKKEVETLRAELETAKAEYAQLSTTLGNADNIASRLNSLRDTYEQAKEFQETEALTTDALNAPDFKEFAQKGSEWGADTNFEIYGKDEGRGTYGFFNREKNDLISYYRNNLSSYENEAARMVNGPTKEMERAYHFAKEMTEDEYNIYAYYLGKGDTDSAQKYLDSIEQSITYRFAENFYEQNLKDANIFEQIIFGFSAGTEQFQTGLENLISDETEYDSSYRQLISGKVQEDLKDSTFGKVAYDLSVTTGNMLPSILASTAIGLINPVAGKWVGTSLMGASASGNAYAEMINLGYDKDQARFYSVLVGASEAGLQSILGHVGKLGGSLSNKAISSAVSKIDNVYARAAIQFGGGMLSEGAEEYLQEVLDPFFKNIAFGEDNDIRFISEEALYSGLLGALSAGILDNVPGIGEQTIAKNIKTYRKGKWIKAAGVTAEQLSELGRKLSVDSEAYKLAGRINENTGAYTIGRMFNELKTEITAQNKAEIKEALRAKGINPVSANSIANWMERVVAGEELTSKQKAALENNPVLGEVMRDVLYERNTTALQRQAGLNSIISQLKEYQIMQALDEAVKKAEKKKAKNTANNTADTQDVQNTAQQTEIEEFEAESDTSLTEDEKANEDNLRVSDNGRTFNTKTGEDLDIVGIASVKGKTFKTADGQTVDSKNVSFATENEAVLFDSVLSMDLPTEIANAIIDGYIPSDNISVTDYLLGSNLAYRYGYAGAKDIELMLDSDVRNIPEHLSKGLYNLGRETAKAEISKGQTEIDSKKTQKSENKAKKKGSVTFDGKELSKEFEDSLTDIQRESLKGVKVIAEVLGNDVNLFASYEAKKGRYKGKRVYKDSNGNVKLAPNGFYNPDGSINLDINSGNLGEGTMLYTLSHELTHHIRKWSPAKFKVLADFVIEQYSGNGIKINDLVYGQMAKAKKNGRSISYGTAYEEVIADACSTMLLDSNAIEKLAQKDKTLSGKIKSFIKDFINKINKWYKNIPPDALEAQYVKDIKGMTDKLQALWFDALEDASSNYTASDSSQVNESGEIKYSYSSIAYSFFGDENVKIEDFENGSFTETKGYKQYVSSCLNNMRQTLGRDFNEAESRKEIEGSIKGIVKVAVAMKKAGYDILDNHEKRGAKDSKQRLLFSSLEPNSDYFTSSDISTICDKRINFASIYDEIVRREAKLGVPKGKRFFDNVDNYFVLHKIMADKGLTQPCRQCYVESMRKNLAPMANAFLKLMQETDPNNKANDQLFHVTGKQKGEIKSNNAELRTKLLEAITSEEYDITADKLTVEMLTTEDGLTQLKLQAPLIYEAFNSFYGQSKPKMPKAATPFRFGELTAMLTDHNGKIKTGLIKKIMSTGGFRLQSYSDFQIQNFADVLQVIFEAGTLGLNGHAYTKVPAFLDATKGTNLKRNISIFMYNDGGKWLIDKNDSFPYDLDKIYDIVNSDKQGNTSIIAVTQNEMMAAWVMANDNIGYFIPFHKSGLKMGTVRDTIVKEGGRKIKGYSGIKDHTRQQTEVWAKTTSDHKANTKVKKGIDIYEFWDFDNAENLSKNKLIEKNIKAYIDACNRAGYLPKFREYVMNNSKVLNSVLNYSKELGFVTQDATIDDISFEYKGYRIPYGYYKCLGDFGMFTPDGKASKINRLSLKNYNFDEAEAFFSNAESLRRTEILQQIANGSERLRYLIGDKKNMTTAEIAEEVQTKRNKVVEEVVSGEYKKIKYSDRDSDGNTLSKEQQEFFKDSKVRDKDGNLLVVYHGTPNAGFTKFKSGTYFTQHKWYADRYQSQGASSLGVKKTADNPDTYAVYLNIKKPFDTRNKTERDIFCNEYYRQWGTGTDLMESGLPDWMDGMDLQEFLEENGYDYDGLILDEGGVGGYGEEVKSRGLSYVTFSSEQVKNIDNKAPTSDPDIHYSDRNPDGGFSNRYLLANALESAAKTAEDKKKLAEYKAKLVKLSEVQQRLQAVNAKIKEISFSKGKKDKVKLAELQKTSKELNDLINRYDKKLFSLESTESLKQVLEREKKAAYKKAAQEGKEALTDYREKAKQREQDIRTKYQESRQKSIEGREKTAMRHKIQKVIMELDGMLRHGTKEKNVKVGLQKVVADAVQAINADTVKLEALRKAYADIRYGKSEDVPAYYMEEAAKIEQKIDEVIDLVGDTPMSEMSLEQLNSVYDMYRMVLTTVRNVNKVFRENKLEDLRVNAEAVMTELNKIPKLKEERAKAFELLRKFSWDEMIPIYAFERLGSDTLKKFFWDTIKAQNVLAEDVNEAKTFADAVREKYNYKKWNRSKIHEFKLKDGRTFRMNLGHMMSIYAYSKRDQAIPHMTTGGFFFNDSSTFRKKGGVLKIIKSTEEGYKVDADMLAEIKESMPKEVIAYVDEMQDYLTKMGEKGNEVSRVIWGIDIFKEKVYFPLKSVRDFVFQSNQPTQEVSLKNDGMTKETKPNASNPIVLEDFDDIWASHVNRMSQYHAFVIPIDNINKIHNYGTWAGTSSVAVSTMIKGRFGESANEYISQFIRDLNGGVSMKGATNPFMSLFAKFKKTAVAASASVVIQQPTAIIRATAMIDTKYFAGKPNVHMIKNYEQLKKYAPIAIIKEIGGFDAGAGRQISSWLNSDTLQGFAEANQKIDDVSMLGAAWGDILGWCTIWDAVKREVKANNKGMDVNSEEFLKKAGKRFTEVIVYTQVYDSTLSRSGFMRSKHDSVKMLTAFMGEPTVSVNMMYNAILQAKRGGKGAKAKAVRTIGAVYLAQIAASAARSAIYALRDDDEEETYLEKFAEAWANDMFGYYGLTGELNPLTQLPAVKDIISIFEGWDVERTDVAVFKDIKDAFDGLFSDNKSTWRKIEDFSGAIASLFGLPVKNILRTGREMYNAVSAIFSDVEGGSFGEAFVRGMTGEEKSKPNKLYDAIVNGDEEMLKMLREGYDDDAAYETAVKKALRENDPRIKEAAEAGYNGDVTERVRIAKEIIAEGNFSQDIVVEAINAEVNAIKKELDSEEGETEDVEEKKAIYSTKDITTALEDGDATLAKEIIADIVSVKVENYMAKDEDLKQKEAEKKAKTSVKSSLSEYWKKLYVEAYNAKNTDEMKRIRFVLKDTGLYGTANDIISTCNNWVKESRKK